MDLKCRKTTCKYNTNCTCTAKKLSIADKLTCTTFEDDPNKETHDTSRCMFDEPLNYAPHREKKSLKVNCQAKCLFNNNGDCIANGLTINDIKNLPFCITNIKP